ncbi:MAG: hypothetical protein ABSG32_14660 [Terriglobia bacterium]|jgi:hypothetical protein
MALPRLWSAALLFALLQLPGQNPPWTPNPSGQGPPAPAPTRFPIDDPRQAPQPAKPKIDAAQVKRDAEELAKLAGEIPPDIEQANKGVVSKELNDRLKRIEKLSKQLRRELFL